MARSRGITIVTIMAAVMGVIAWQVHGLRARSADALGPTGETGLTLYPGGRGIEAPPVRGSTVDGKDLALADLRGRVVVLNVWGTWCGPCRAEAPELAEVARRTRRDGVRFVGIDVRDNPAAARAFARRYDITYPSWDDQDGAVLAQFAGVIPVSAVPSTMVVDADGVIRARVIGRIDATTLRGLIKDAHQVD